MGFAEIKLKQNLIFSTNSYILDGLPNVVNSYHQFTYRQKYNF